MAHGDVGRLTAYLDGQLASEELGVVARHLGSCRDCQDAVERLTAQKARMSAALATLDIDCAAAADRALAEVRARRAAMSERAPVPLVRKRSGVDRFLANRRQLLQAAVFVLFVAGGVSALVPGSPLRRMLGGGEVEEAPQEVVPTLAPPAAVQAERVPEMRVRAGASQGALRVALQLASGSELVVALVAGDSAAVVVPVDANVRGSEGLLEATAPTGPVRVDLPSGVPDVSLEVGGQVYLRVRGGLLDVIAPTTGRSDTQVSFRIP
jgi:hypothetical protein